MLPESTTLMCFINSNHLVCMTYGEDTDSTTRRPKKPDVLSLASLPSLEEQRIFPESTLFNLHFANSL